MSGDPRDSAVERKRFLSSPARRRPLVDKWEWRDGEFRKRGRGRPPKLVSLLGGPFLKSKLSRPGNPGIYDATAIRARVHEYQANALSEGRPIKSETALRELMIQSLPKGRPDLYRDFLRKKKSLEHEFSEKIAARTAFELVAGKHFEVLRKLLKPARKRASRL